MERHELDFLVDYTDDVLLAELRRISALLPAGAALLGVVRGARDLERLLRVWCQTMVPKVIQ